VIERYYAAHIKTSRHILKTSPDATATDVMRPKKNKKGKKRSGTLRRRRNLQIGNGCVKSGEVLYHV
jgi:hypothetical protein